MGKRKSTVEFVYCVHPVRFVAQPQSGPCHLTSFTHNCVFYFVRNLERRERSIPPENLLENLIASGVNTLCMFMTNLDNEIMKYDLSVSTSSNSDDCNFWKTTYKQLKTKLKLTLFVSYNNFMNYNNLFA